MQAFDEHPKKFKTFDNLVFEFYNFLFRRAGQTNLLRSSRSKNTPSIDEKEKKN